MFIKNNHEYAFIVIKYIFIRCEQIRQKQNLWLRIN